jgi:hypothetical protein
MNNSWNKIKIFDKIIINKNQKHYSESDKEDQISNHIDNNQK